MREKLIDERLDLADAICYAMRDWDDYMDECRETETPPIDSFEDFIADGVLSAGYRKQRWIPVAERLPNLHEAVLVYTLTHDVLKAHFRGERSFFGHDGIWRSVTHWMPLPTPPKEDDHAGKDVS